MKKLIMICFVLVLAIAAFAQDGKAPASGLSTANGKSNSSNYNKSYNKSYDNNNNSSNSEGGIANKDMIWHLTYFNALKDGDKGAYGFGIDGVGDPYGIGMSMRMTTNAFLVDSDNLVIKTSFGANYHAALGDMAMFTFPVLVGCFGYNEFSYDSNTGKTKKKYKFGFDLEVLPALVVGRNAGVSIGPYYIYNFPSKKGGWGGHVSIWF